MIEWNDPKENGYPIDGSTVVVMECFDVNDKDENGIPKSLKPYVGIYWEDKPKEEIWDENWYGPGVYERIWNYQIVDKDDIVAWSEVTIPTEILGL
jgi:hypothetical protein